MSKDSELRSSQSSEWAVSEISITLEVAERLLRNVDRERLLVRALRGVQVLLICFGGFLTATAFVVADTPSLLVRLLLAAIAAGVIIFVLAIVSPLVAMSVRHLMRDERTMLEVAGIVRGLLLFVDEQTEGASYQLTRARLARFPIGDSEEKRA